MNDSLSRLLWALPLVLGVGVIAILLLKRALDRVGVSAQVTERLQLAQSVDLSEGQRAHLLEVDGQCVLVVAGPNHTVLQLLPSRVTPRNGKVWMRSPRA